MKPIGFSFRVFEKNVNILGDIIPDLEAAAVVHLPVYERLEFGLRPQAEGQEGVGAGPRLPHDAVPRHQPRRHGVLLRRRGLVLVERVERLEEF